MLVRPSEQESQEQYLQDSLIPRPTAVRSAFETAGAEFLKPIALLDDAARTLTGAPEGQSLRNAIDGIENQQAMQPVAGPRAVANFTAGMIGSALNPINMMFGAIGGKVVGAGIGALEKAAPVVSKPVAELLSEPIRKSIPEGLLSATLPGPKIAKTVFGTLPAFAAPGAVYDVDNIGWGGVAKDMAAMGAFGLAIESVPFAWGVLRGRVRSGVGKIHDEPIAPLDYEKALATGHISEEEYAWVKAVEKGENEPVLREQANKILADRGHKVNFATSEVPYEIVPNEQYRHLQSAAMDELLGDAPENIKTSLSDFIIHNSLDELRENPNGIEGLRGYRDFIQKKLEKKPERLAAHDKALDEILGAEPPQPATTEKGYDLREIKEKLMTPEGLKKNWQKSPEYDRLRDLAPHWPAAQRLLDRVHHEAEYERQESFAHLADQVLKIADSDAPKLANRDNVVKYLKARIDQRVSKPAKIEMPKAEVPQNADDLISAHEARIAETKAKEQAEEFEVARDRFKEFKKSEGIFKNFIQCVMGGLGG